MKLVINRIVMAILIGCFISACGKKEAPGPAAGTEEILFFKIQFIIVDVKI
jgi:hypothetical protein